MKSTILYSFVLTIILAGLLSCKKGFLDVASNTQRLYLENYVKDLSTMEEYLNGVQLQFNIVYTSGNNNNGVYADITGDDLKPIDENQQGLALYKWMQRQSIPGVYEGIINMDGAWKGNYRVIRAANFIIENVDRYRSENNVKADYIKGQALFFRACTYFRLVNIFAQPYSYTADASHPGVPYITSSDPSISYQRQTVREVYEAIFSDLTSAARLMKTTIVNDTRYVGEDAAKALLARVFLFKADYQKANELAKEICLKYPLLSIAKGYPNSLYNNGVVGQTEVVFQATPTALPDDTYLLGIYLKEDSPFFKYFATADIVDLLQESSSDVRNAWVKQRGGDWLVSKFPPGAAGLISRKEGDYYEPIVRSSEMFLTVAEASAKTGDENTSRTYLNLVRKRADPSATDIDATGEMLLTAIYKERRKEHCFENFRLFDLKRLGMPVNRVDILPGSPTTLPYPSDKAVAPIPRLEIDLMGLSQNKGY